LEPHPAKEEGNHEDYPSETREATQKTEKIRVIQPPSNGGEKRQSTGRGAWKGSCVDWGPCPDFCGEGEEEPVYPESGTEIDIF